MRVPLLCSIFLLSIPVAQADEQLRSTQEELRRRNLYFGEIDGRPTSELNEAVKRFQQRKGFTATGQPDAPTLRLLGLTPREGTPPGRKEAPLPDEPVLKSDIPISPLAEAKAVARETGISLFELAPVAEQGPGGSSQSRRGFSNGARGKRGQVLAPATQRGGSTFQGQPQDARTRQADAAKLGPLLRGYLSAASGNDTREELRYLADRVDYLGHGWMDRRVIERTLRSFYLRWPKHSYKLAGPVSYQRDPVHNVYVVSCVVEFDLRRGSVKAKGRLMNRFVFDGGTSDPRIISIQEERVRGQ